ncbi:alpha/beta fold hydrolase, partial [Sphingomonas solaris]
MPLARCNGIDIAYETGGAADGIPLLMIHGLGAQLTRWPDSLCAALGTAGFRTIRFDSRDVGLSTHFPDVPVPDLAAVMAAMQRGEVPDLPYTLSDMAADTAGLLDALGLERAHVLGVSLGGMIAQGLAIEHPARGLSLTVMMSQSGNPALPPSDPALLAIMAATPPDPAVDHEAFLRHSVTLNRALGSPDYPTTEADLRTFATTAAARAYDPSGSGRQLAAARGAADRRPGLAALDVPTLVIHGAADRLILPECGEDIARHVKGAWMVTVNGMGHDLPDPLTDLFVATIRANAARAAAFARIVATNRS